MKMIHIVLMSAGFLFIAGCSKKNTDASQTGETTGSSSTSKPVETNPPNSNYKAAFDGQTRIGAVKTSTAFSATVITSSLTSPLAITNLPDGRFLITEKAGNIHIVTSSGQVGTRLTGVPAVSSSGQGGLLGICADPGFGSNRMIYWTYSEPGSGGNLLAIAKGRLSANESGLENVTVIYRATPNYPGINQYGGRIIFDRAGNLIVSSGDRSDPAIRIQAQSLNSAIGKILRITTDGQPAAGNPFIGQAGALPEIYTLGHRNEYGLSFHPATGDLWEAELGPRGGDEINLIRAGANYGWPVITYGIDYSGQPIGNAIQQRNGMEQPVYYWDPVISPGGITFYKGSRVPEWENNLFVCALSGQHIDRLVITNNRVSGEERLLVSEGQRFRDITQGTDNALYAITDGGRLYRIDRQ